MGLKIEYLTPDQLRPYANNAKLHPETQVEQISNSIQEFGFSDPIGIWGENEVVEGHGRLMAAMRLGLDKVPVIRLDHLTDEQRRAYALAHNQTTMTSGWDADKLLSELKDIGGGIDMSAFGFEPLPENIDDVVEDDYEEPDDIEARTKLGNIWACGDHVLLCGDSADAETQKKLFHGHAPKMIFTDPPYGVAIGDKNKMLDEAGGGESGRIKTNIAGDTLSSNDLYKVLVEAFRNLKDNADPAASYYVSSPQDGELGLMMMMMRDAGLQVRHMLIWVKNSAAFSLGRLDYDYRHEPIFYTWTKKHDFYGGYSNTVIDDTKPLEKMTKTELKELVHALQDSRETSVLYCDKPTHCDLHPTMKPVKLVGRFIINSSREGDTVADIFGGSGTTMIACEQLHRKCRMIELDPHYCDVILDRWEKFTGKKAELIA